jgi:hypothetical protein
MHPRSLFVIDLLLHEVVDLTTPVQLEAWGLTTADLIASNLDRCQEVSGVAARLGAEAIRWASATGVGQSFALFVDQLRPGSHAEIAKSFDLTSETLRAIAAGTSVATLITGLGDVPLLE